MVRFFSIIGLFFISSCIGQQTLKDGFTKVPSVSYKFSKRQKFNSEIFNKINLNYFYKLDYSYQADSNFKNKGEKMLEKWIKILQFYPNGQVREFAQKYADKDPDITGNRGIIYEKGKDIYIDMYGAVSDGGMKILTYKVKIEDDKIFVIEKNFLMGVNGDCRVFMKSEKIPEEWKKYKADW
jgi:hypothetical protein